MTVLGKHDVFATVTPHLGIRQSQRRFSTSFRWSVAVDAQDEQLRAGVDLGLPGAQRAQIVLDRRDRIHRLAAQGLGRRHQADRVQVGHIGSTLSVGAGVIEGRVLGVANVGQPFLVLNRSDHTSAFFAHGYGLDPPSELVAREAAPLMIESHPFRGVAEAFDARQKPHEIRMVMEGVMHGQ